jgi:hypothetical protein
VDARLPFCSVQGIAFIIVFSAFRCPSGIRRLGMPSERAGGRFRGFGSAWSKSAAGGLSRAQLCARRRRM